MKGTSRSGIDTFIREFVAAIGNGAAAIFAGAGMSATAGYVDWKGLLRDIADELGLDVDKETDLLTVAQYHVNRFQRERINHKLLNEFTSESSPTINHHLIARMPIDTIWTTNYDRLFERALEAGGKTVDVKVDPRDLALTRAHRDVVLYKMHGSAERPHEAVLIKDDYERYESQRRLFASALQGDLVSKTFLFLGYSFRDPNLGYILARIRGLLENDVRTHYCLMRKVNRDEYSDEEAFRYASTRQELQCQDLLRYGIRVVEVDSYDDVTEILKHIAFSVSRQNVFISGSAETYGSWSTDRALTFARRLAGILIEDQFKVVSGYGLGVGSAVILGVAETANRLHRAFQDVAILRPFPQGIADAEERRRTWTAWRQDILQSCGVSVYVFGNKRTNSGDIANADGMIEEFELGVSLGAIPIPIGATGYVARQLWDRVMADFDNYVPVHELHSLYLQLNDEDDERILAVVANIAKRLRGAAWAKPHA